MCLKSSTKANEFFKERQKLLGTSHKAAYKELQHVIRKANLKGKIPKQHRLTVLELLLLTFPK